MAENHNKHANQDPEQVIEQSLGRFELFIERNGKKLLMALGALIVIVGGYFSYKYLYLAPRAKQASAAMFEAQNYFERDSFALALNGNAAFDGFLTIADEYGNTPQGNLARHYAGMCYLYLGEFQQAIDAFEKYDASKDNAAAELIGAQNLGMRGDAYVELGNLEQGAKLYERAAEFSDNVATTPVYLKKAGMIHEQAGHAQQALNLYERIRNGYPRSIPARDIEKFIARAQQQL